MPENRLPPSFDLFLDVKDYEQLVVLYTQVCSTKQIIEDLCRTYEITIPATSAKE
jgi:hypothetical protein